MSETLPQDHTYNYINEQRTAAYLRGKKQQAYVLVEGPDGQIAPTHLIDMHQSSDLADSPFEQGGQIHIPPEMLSD